MKLIQLERKLLKIYILSLHILIFSMYLLYQFSSAELNLSQIFAAKRSCIKIVIVYHKQVSNIFFYLECNRILILHLVIILSIFQLLPPHFVLIFFCVQRARRSEACKMTKDQERELYSNETGHLTVYEFFYNVSDFLSLTSWQAIVLSVIYCVINVKRIYFYTWQQRCISSPKSFNYFCFSIVIQELCIIFIKF